MSYAGYRGTITTTGSRGTQGRGNSGYRGTECTEEQRIRGYKGTAGRNIGHRGTGGQRVSRNTGYRGTGQMDNGYRGTEEHWVQRNSGYRGTVGSEEQRNTGHGGTAVKWDKTNTKVVIYRIHQKNLPILQLKCRIKSELRPCIEQFRNHFSLTHFSVTNPLKKVVILLY